MHTFERRCISPQKHRSSSEAWRWEHQDVGLFSSLHWNAWQNWRKDGNIYRDNKNCCHLSGWWRWNWRLKPRSWFHRRKIKHGPANQLTRKNQVITNKGFCICIKYISVTMFNVFPVSFMVWLDGLDLVGILCHIGDVFSTYFTHRVWVSVCCIDFTSYKFNCNEWDVWPDLRVNSSQFTFIFAKDTEDSAKLEISLCQLLQKGSTNKTNITIYI